jgi:hypothetical protein
MAPNRIMWGGATLAALVVIGIFAGCGGGGSSSAGSSSTATTATETVPPENAADAALLDKVLARQEGAVAAYTALIPALPARLAPLATYLRTQDQEHVDGVLRALWGLETPAEPTPESIEAGGLKTDRERLELLYEVENAAIAEELSAIAKLEGTTARTILASTVANQGQHLTLLRRALGAGPAAQMPAPFENGTTPPPVG